MVTKKRSFSSLKNPPIGFSPSGLEFSWPLLQPSPLASISLPQNSTPYHLQISLGLTNKKVKMERNSLSNHSIGGGRSAKGIININNNRVKDSWEYSSTTSEGDLLSGFHPWPPRSYTCSFCKREFRSAQALGGHMNVHRRDRARLRQSPPRNGDYPSLNLNLNSSPNPNPNPDYPHVLIPMVSPSLSTLSSPSSASSSGIKKWVMFHNKGADLTKIKDAKTLVGVREFEGFTQDRGYEVVKKSGIVRLDLEIGLVSDSEEEDLDLELRLGRS